MKKHSFCFWGLLSTLVSAAFLCLSCQGRKAVDIPFEDISTAPGQTVYGSHTLATEQGKAQVFMEYPCMSNYTGHEQGNEPHQVFPNGIKSTFYGEDGQTVDVLMFADSAINLQDKKLMKFFGNVQVYDYRSLDTIYTEALFWNQETRKIYSDVAVRKVSPGLVLEGDGFDSDERMENVVLRRPRGVIR